MIPLQKIKKIGITQLFHTITNVYAPHLPCHEQSSCLCISWEVSLPRTPEIPAIGFVISALKRVTADSLDPDAQVALKIQCIPHSYVLATSFVQVIASDQEIVKLFNRRSAMQITGQRNIE
jgi:hypothetical protein